MFWAVLAEAALLALACIGYVELLDRHDALRRARRAPPIVVQPLPRAVAVPAKWRKERWR